MGRITLRDQAIKVVVSLVGRQDVAVAAHRPGTEGATVSVRVGGALIYIQDAETARTFHRAWQSGARQGWSLPARSDPAQVMPVAGVVEPVVMMDAAKSPPARAHLEQELGRPRRLWVVVGRIGFDVRDQAALRSTIVAFRQADHLAASVFTPTPEERACERAARTAARLFATPAAPRPFVAAPRRAIAARPAAAVSRAAMERTG